MGNDNSNPSSCTGSDAPGLNQMCYQAGYDSTRSSDTIPDAVQAGVCTINAQSNACYGQGVSDGMILSKM
jgi:hypothetical protein